MKSHVFTDEDFTLFNLKVGEYIAAFGITGWIVDVEHEQIGDGACAQLSFDVVSRKCCIRLTKVVEYDFGMDSDPDALAKHEVLHLLLADFCWTAAHEKDHCCDAVVAKEHELINRLMEVL